MTTNEAVVLLDRIVEGVTPPYCLHGRVQCLRCHQWCHLGHSTERVVASGEARPLCMDCVQEMRELAQWPDDIKPSTRYEDHLRTDGPHDTERPTGWVNAPCANPLCRKTVWVPPVADPTVLVVKVCSPACAKVMMNAHTKVWDR